MLCYRNSMLRKKIGDFYLVKQLGSGQISQVYLGISPRTREKRAYKILGKNASFGAISYGRFIREVGVIRELAHPGIIKVLEHGILDRGYFYAMEFMRGGNLAMRLDRGKMPVDTAIRLFSPICDAIAYAHEQGIAHGDLKPSNILLNADGEPVISGFTIDGTPDPERLPRVRPGKILGTIAYLAPEQRFGSKNTNRRADVFALGAILYQMMMGFPALGNFPMPTEAKPDFPRYLQAILEKCLASNPNERFENAGQLQYQLGKWLDQRAQAPAAFLGLAHAENRLMLQEKTDRIESWFRVLRSGTSRERLAIVREMTETLTPAEAKTIMKLYADEEELVRAGLIRVLGELRIAAATPLILNDLNSSVYAECAIEALGKIGSCEAYDSIREFVANHPERAVIALVPMAKTGKQRAIKTLEQYLSHESATLRQTAVCALATIESAESLVILKEHLCVEYDEKVRSALIQAVHSLQRALHPALKMGMLAAGARSSVA